ncbi:type VII secretion protein EccE [Williamsia sp.]|uniref:type VII secretion protein EccE n=1 Tax=Williamsia sp. TaxID=1872085 RepID=UPI001A28102C|nr:type VII secretion protein EccE [Williamsia sp.]MBJ7291449.1 type VII secretion protein EccE [Williamsia sp.]
MTDPGEFEVTRPDTPWVGRVLPSTSLVIAEILVGVITLALAPVGLPWWVGVVVGVVIAVPLLARIGGVSLTRRMGGRISHIGRRRRNRNGPEAPFDVPMPEGGSCGMRWDGDRLITVIRVDADARALTRFIPGRTITDDIVPLDLIAECLTQFDILVDSVDVISRGSRAWGGGPIAEIYRRILGPLPATAFRSVVVVLRLDPLRNATAVERRGGGSTGALRTAAVATRRVAGRLAGRGRAATILTASEATALVGVLTEGVDLADLDEKRTHLDLGALQTTTHWLDESALTDVGVTAPWTVQSMNTVVAIHLRRSGSDPDERVAISALARFTTTPGTEIDTPAGFRPMDGRQRTALVATLPLADPFRNRDGWEFITTVDALRGLPLPAAGCGQLVGADADGRAVALPLVGSSVRSVEIAGSLHLGQQVILRAIALGARVMVTSDRPGDWMRMAKTVGNPQVLAVAGAAAGSQVAGARQGYSVLVFDGTPPPFQSAEVTTIAITAPGRTPSDHVDVSLAQNDETGTWVTVRSGSESIRAMMVASADELNFIGHSVGVHRTGSTTVPR